MRFTNLCNKQNVQERHEEKLQPAECHQPLSSLSSLYKYRANCSRLPASSIDVLTQNFGAQLEAELELIETNAYIIRVRNLTCNRYRITSIFMSLRREPFRSGGNSRIKFHRRLIIASRLRRAK